MADSLLSDGIKESATCVQKHRRPKKSRVLRAEDNSSLGNGENDVRPDLSSLLRRILDHLPEKDVWPRCHSTAGVFEV